MLTLPQGRPATLDVVLHAQGGAPRTGVAPEDLVCQLKQPGSLVWAAKELDASTWREAGHGAYLLGLNPAEVDQPGVLTIRLAGRTGLLPALHDLLFQVAVAPVRELALPPPELPRTVLIGQVVGVDGKPIPRAAVSATLVQVPLLLRGTAVAGDGITVHGDQHGSFELALLTGATVDLHIPLVRFRRTLVVPAPPAPGAPVRLFSIP